MLERLGTTRCEGAVETIQFTNKETVKPTQSHITRRLLKPGPSYHLVMTGLIKVVEEGETMVDAPQDGNEYKMKNHPATCKSAGWFHGSDGIRTRDLSLDRAAC